MGFYKLTNYAYGESNCSYYAEERSQDAISDYLVLLNNGVSCSLTYDPEKGKNFGISDLIYAWNSDSNEITMTVESEYISFLEMLHGIKQFKSDYPVEYAFTYLKQKPKILFAYSKVRTALLNFIKPENLEKVFAEHEKQD